MFDYIKGILEYKNSLGSLSLSVETGGIGYLISVLSRDFTNVQIGKNIKIYTILIHKEDSMTLYGFTKKEDRDIFKILTSVSGVGPKMALMLLDEFEAFDLVPLVIKGDYKELTRAKGVGPKLAQKIIIELKDKLVNLQNELPITISDDVEIKDEQSIQDAQSVLISLGYEREEIKKAISHALKFIKKSSNAEDILKETLKILANPSGV